MKYKSSLILDWLQEVTTSEMSSYWLRQSDTSGWLKVYSVNPSDYQIILTNHCSWVPSKPIKRILQHFSLNSSIILSCWTYYLIAWAKSTHFHCSTGCPFSCSRVSNCCRPAWSAGPPARGRRQWVQMKPCLEHLMLSMLKANLYFELVAFSLFNTGGAEKQSERAD